MKERIDKDMAKSRKIAGEEEEKENMQVEEEEEEEDEDDDEHEDEEMSEDEMINKEIEVNFEAITPDDSDIDGIKRLLQQLFLKAHINLSELSELIIQQNYVSSVIKQEIGEEEEDDDVDDEDFGMISVINITDKKDVNCVSQIRSFLGNHCKGAGPEGKKLISILEDPNARVGLILSERFMNIPPKIALPLYENLRMDMKKAVDKNMKFDFSHYLLISKIYRQKMAKKDESIIFANAEEEFFAEEAEVQFEYSVANESDTVMMGGWSEDDGEWKPSRKILLMSGPKLDVVIQKLQSEFL
ncbi:BRCA2 and CDKN1A-interacting protein isoform X1 [Centruroides vittatus]|uniref:BRCA2 and CDKN1A-interacting protein isoform X1 n=2 Tax=Centruroides vittatus TaxID=120091 RepID=UPI00350E8DFA